MNTGLGISHDINLIVSEEHHRNVPGAHWNILVAPPRKENCSTLEYEHDP
jgi:hypothetical protein